jgi:hypothetical protein
LVTEDNIYNTGTVNWWVGVEGAGELFNTGHCYFFLSGVLGDEGDATSTLSVKTEVLGE